MASNKFVILAMVITIVLPTVAFATDYIVGDARGWTTNFDYQDWAKDKVFMVGDKLVFQYDPSVHNVFKVNGTAFKDCSVPPPKEALTTGNDTIALTTPGPKWYICGVAGHCSDLKQKLTITVLSEIAPAPSLASPEKSAAYGVMKSGYQVIVMAAMVAVAIYDRSLLV